MSNKQKLQKSQREKEQIKFLKTESAINAQNKQNLRRIIEAKFRTNFNTIITTKF
jgi:hypothetical protein